MPVPVVAALLLAALVTLIALVWVVRRLVGRLVRLGRDLDRLQSDLNPALDALRRDVEITGTEVAALGDRVDRVAQQRRARRRRRWRPPPPARPPTPPPPTSPSGFDPAAPDR